MSKQRRTTAVIAAGLVVGLVGGAALGVVWWRLAPRVPVVVDPGRFQPGGFQPEGYLAADIAFGALALLAGIAVTVGLARMRREHLVSVLVAALLAAAVGTAAMWFVGTKLGSVDIEGLSATTEAQVIVDGPLTVTMPAMFLIWPITAAVVVTILSLTDWMSGNRADTD